MRSRELPEIELVEVSELTAAEKDQLLSEIVHHLGRKIERTKWSNLTNISLVHSRIDR